MHLKIRLNGNRNETNRAKPNHVHLKSTKAFPLLRFRKTPPTWSQTPAKLNEKYPFRVRWVCVFSGCASELLLRFQTYSPNSPDYFQTPNIVGKKQFYFIERILSNTKGFSMHEQQLLSLFFCLSKNVQFSWLGRKYFASLLNYFKPPKIKSLQFLRHELAKN